MLKADWCILLDWNHVEVIPDKNNLGIYVLISYWRNDAMTFMIVQNEG